MFQMLNSWILTLFVSITICMVSEFLIVKKEFEKIIRTVLNVFFLLSVLYPLKYVNFKIKNIDFDFKNEKIENKLDGRIKEVSKKYIKEKISNFLKNNSVKPKKLDIHISDENITCEISLDKEDEQIVEKLKKEFKISLVLVG